MKGIRQLADHLDISIGTVSRALNGKPDVNDETRRRVLEAAEKFGYVANQAGRSLRKGATGIIGFMMQTGHEITGQGDTFFMSVFDGVQTVLARHKLDLVALLCSSEEDPDAYMKRVVARGFADGIILSATRYRDDRFGTLHKAGIPFISLGRSRSDVGQPWYDLDFEGMAETAIDRLVAKGHKKIAIGRPEGEINLGYVFEERCHAALARHGLRLDPAHVFRSRPNESGGYKLARNFIAAPAQPTAMVLLNEATVIGFYRGLEEAGLTPGREVAVIGQYSPLVQFLSPRLTCFRPALRDLGVAVAESLLSTMPAFADAYPQAPRQCLWPMNFIEGESG
ncbi:transcriptional regulator, LacI family [Rhizobium sp. RU35A]|uniref:LacI family DNA-binding transcriptional regulator n=1 Tax=Rhizobium straminoryzae TaxID=1387186 RepID=A0A549TBE3_9HYPH|nr:MULTISPECIES: LacI family DNA-binding transcriptional regulator [Rhizobium]TRL39200.1 LacI family DNA-binding transcriptional regulator [Rhizobium straminoryzae]SIQ38180.1 transcriptional regulator, LacI family [Rhizobium sp. RU35A]